MPVAPSQSSRAQELQGEIERFVKDSQLLRELEGSEVSRGSRACVMLKEELKAKSD